MSRQLRGGREGEMEDMLEELARLSADDVAVVGAALSTHGLP